MLAVVLFLLCHGGAQAQNKVDLPHFRIGRSDKTYFDDNDLKKDKPIVLIYFLPDCEDCRAFTRSLLANIKHYQNLQIVLVTNTPLSILIQFEKDFSLRKFNNIVAGTESYTMVLQRALNVQSFPSVNCYNKHKKLVKKINNYKELENLRL